MLPVINIVRNSLSLILSLLRNRLSLLLYLLFLYIYKILSKLLKKYIVLSNSFISLFNSLYLINMSVIFCLGVVIKKSCLNLYEQYECNIIEEYLIIFCVFNLNSYKK